MITYVPTSGQPVADQLSRALWALSAMPGSGRQTTQVFSSITCLDGSVWLAVHTEFSVPVHPDAVLGEDIPDILQYWINEGILPAETVPQLAALVESKRGQRLNLWEAFPQLFKEQSRTREQLVILGLLTNSIPS